MYYNNKAMDILLMCIKPPFCHFGLRAGRMSGDQESSSFDMFWIPACAGMTIIELLTRTSLFNKIFHNQFFIQHQIGFGKLLTCGIDRDSFDFRGFSKVIIQGVFDLAWCCR